MVPRPYQSATASHSMPLPRGVPESPTVNTIPSSNPHTSISGVSTMAWKGMGLYRFI